jgi:Fe-S-cluster containining protein
MKENRMSSYVEEKEEFICVRCAKEQATCCQKTEVLLTPPDIRRIEKSAGGKDFHERKAPSNPDQMPDKASDALWAAAFASDGTRTILKHKDNSDDCIFLAENGCVLELQTRPYVCQLYPYDYTKDCLTGVSAHHCPRALQENPALALAYLGMSRDDAEQARAALYQGLAESAERS